MDFRDRITVLGSKDGSAMVEAAVVFPVVVLTLMVLIYGMLFLFNEAAAGTACRQAAVREAGRSAGTFALTGAGTSGVTASSYVYGIRPCAVSEKTVRFAGHMPGVRDRRRTILSHQYIMNEKAEIRLLDVFQ